VTLNSEQQIVSAHTATVVSYNKARLAAMFDFDVKARSARIDGVFHELFDHGGGTFNHLTRSDAVHRAGGKPVNCNSILVGRRRSIRHS
jgi:hypothetical protein